MSGWNCGFVICTYRVKVEKLSLAAIGQVRVELARFSNCQAGHISPARGCLTSEGFVIQECFGEGEIIRACTHTALRSGSLSVVLSHMGRQLISKPCLLPMLDLHLMTLAIILGHYTLESPMKILHLRFSNGDSPVEIPHAPYLTLCQPEVQERIYIHEF